MCMDTPVVLGYSLASHDLPDSYTGLRATSGTQAIREVRVRINKSPLGGHVTFSCIEDHV